MNWYYMHACMAVFPSSSSFFWFGLQFIWLGINVFSSVYIVTWACEPVQIVINDIDSACYL